jgi:hypothetical protein
MGANFQRQLGATFSANGVQLSTPIGCNFAQEYAILPILALLLFYCPY